MIHPSEHNLAEHINVPNFYDHLEQMDLQENRKNYFSSDSFLSQHQNALTKDNNNYPVKENARKKSQQFLKIINSHYEKFLESVKSKIPNADQILKDRKIIINNLIKTFWLTNKGITSQAYAQALVSFEFKADQEMFVQKNLGNDISKYLPFFHPRNIQEKLCILKKENPELYQSAVCEIEQQFSKELEDFYNITRNVYGS